ncbi:MAG TPA: alpha-(1-_3)-arabinofuranosyltransferase family protein [Acidimicrobiales bacterium]|nr:alpha-(1->3)-arabinofuranosyltransferase family protein [Acidimicrobiales bacterium]
MSGARARRPDGRPRWAAGDGPVTVLLAAVAYIPLLFTAPGRVEADTKSYLYLDPGRMLLRAVSMWDPNTAMGTVTHQNIGYLFPQGPWYLAFHAVGVPTWIAQRLWTGTLLFAAGAGVLFLLRTLGQRGAGPAVAALAYMLSPYLLAYEARESALILPWAGLPWLIGLTARAAHRGGWRHPAMFAVVVALIGSINATALIDAGIGPALWLAWEVAGRRVSWRRAAATAARLVLLAGLVSLWWAVGLAIEGAYGMDVLRYTETIPTVARSSLASEVLRGLGYWFFYGQDKLGAYLPMAVPYQTSVWLIAVSFAVPVASFLAAVVVRWRDRAYFVALVVVGTVLSVGVHPYDSPSPLGALFKAFASSSTAGLAMRSSSRATPLVVLSTAVFLGLGVAAAGRRARAAGVGTAVVAVGLVAADLPSLWTGGFVAANLTRPSQLPAYWTQAAAYLDAQPHDTRVLSLPGQDFSVYDWGTTLDPVLPGLMDRPEVDRGLVPFGSPQTADLLDSLDEPLQQSTFDPAVLAPMARLMSAGDVLFDFDQLYEQYNTPRPQPLWQQLVPTPAGLGPPVGFGPAAPAPHVKYPLVDETHLGVPAGAPYPQRLEVFPVPGARPILRAESTSSPTVVDGSGQGLVEAAGAGLLAGDPTVVYAASDPRAGSAPGAALVVTDTNQRRAQQFGTVTDNYGYVERAGEKPATPDTRDARLPLFPGVTDAERTVSVQTGLTATASDYGNPITYNPENRADQAFDGDTTTAWETSAFDDADGQWVQARYDTPVTTNSVDLVQPLVGPRNRWITKATLTFDGGSPVTVRLGPQSRTAAGQTVRFPTRTFSTLRVTVDATNIGPIHGVYDGQSAVGFAEIKTPAGPVAESLRMPTDLLAGTGPSSQSHRLTLLMSRERAPGVPPRSDPELTISRTFTLPTTRSFSVSGTAHISALDPDPQIDGLLGEKTGVVASSSGRLPGDIAARASATLDGDPSTVWSPGLGPQNGSWLQYDMGRSRTVSSLTLTLVADPEHSVPQEVDVSAGGTTRSVALPPVAPGPVGTTRTVTVNFPAVTGSSLRVTFTKVKLTTSLDYYSEQPIALPLAVAEVRFPGLEAGTSTPSQVPGTCRSDLLAVDGRPVPVRLVGSTAAAQQAVNELSLQTCGSTADGVTLGAGTHTVTTASWQHGGLDVDGLVLDSAPGGAPGAVSPAGQVDGAPSPPAPAVTVRSAGATSAEVVVHHPTGPFRLVLGESLNAGWHAVAAGKDLGRPQLVDGYANSWVVNPPAGGGDLVVSLTWAPQKWVWAGLGLSAAALVACVGMAVAGTRRRRRRAAVGPVRDSAVAGAPQLAAPGRGGSRPSGRVLAGVTVAAGAVAAVLIAPWAAVPVAAAALVATATTRGRLVTAVGAVGLLGAAGAVVAVGEATSHYAAGFGWPTDFGPANWLAWLAVAFLACDAVASVARRPGTS